MFTSRHKENLPHKLCNIPVKTTTLAFKWAFNPYQGRGANVSKAGNTSQNAGIIIIEIKNSKLFENRSNLYHHIS